MNLQHYLTVIKSIQTNIITYLDREDNIEENFQNIIKIFDDEKILENLNKIKLIFHLLLELSNNHYRLLNFFSKIEQIFLYFKDSMTKFFSNKEIFDFFKSNKRIILFLIKEKVITFDEYVKKQLQNDEYFTPEINEFNNRSHDNESTNQATNDSNKSTYYIRIRKNMTDNRDKYGNGRYYSYEFDLNMKYIMKSDDDNNYKMQNEKVSNLEEDYSESSQKQNDDESNQEQNEDESNQEQNEDESNQEQNEDESNQEQNDDESNQEQNNDESNQEQNDDESNQEQNDDGSNQEQNNDESNQEQNKEDYNLDEIYSEYNQEDEPKKEQFDFDIFDKKRTIGENDDELCKIIQKDLIEDFIIYVTKNQTSLRTKIKPSIFETNLLLIENEPELIEYTAFFGSIQIFKYLFLNGVELKSSLWIYSIHGDNEEMIRILEDNKILPEDETYEECYEESIKCHHNEIINYIEYNYITDKSKNHLELYSYWYQHYNFELIPNELNEDSFYDLIEYEYYTIIELLQKEKYIDINKKIEKIDEEYHEVSGYYYHRRYYRETTESTPLIIAIEKGNLDIIQLILSNSDVDVNIKSTRKIKYYQSIYTDEYEEYGTDKIIDTPALFIACKKGNPDIVKLLLSDPKIDVNDKNIKHDGNNIIKESTPLHIAIKKLNQDIVELLLKNRNIDVNCIKYTKDSQIISKIPAIYEAVASKNVNIVKFLVSHPNIDINFKATFTKNNIISLEAPALFNAIYDEDIEMIHVLLSHPNININNTSIKRDDKYLNNECIENTVLFTALNCKNYDIMQLLLSYPSIDVNFPETITCNKILLAKRSLLFKAVVTKNVKFVELLLSNQNIDVNYKSFWKSLNPTLISKMTSLYAAVKLKNIQIINLLLSHPKIDLNIRSFKFANFKKSQKTVLY